MSYVKNKKFYTWVSQVLDNNVLDLILQEYYDDEEVYSVTVDGSEYSYSIGTHNQLLYPHIGAESVEDWDFESPMTDAESDYEALQDYSQLLSLRKNNTVADDPEEIDIDDFLWNDPTYILTETEFDRPESSVTFSRTQSDFYTVTNRATELVFELVDAILEDHYVGSKQVSASDVLENELPLRDRYFSSIPDRVNSISERPHGVGGSYLTLIKADDEYHVFIGNRSEDVAFWPEKYSVLPTGFLQKSEVSLGHPLQQHMLTEYAKEFYDYDRPNSSSRAVKSLHQLLTSDDAKFDITGSGLNLLHGHMEFTGVLIINYDSYIGYMEEHTSESFVHDSVSLIPLSDLPDVIDSLVDPQNITPTSAFALLNGLHYLDEETDISIPVDVEVDQYEPDRPDRLSE